MGDSTKIQWTESTWNPVRGCTVVSPGCEHCYAMGVAARFSGKGQPYEGLAKFSPARRLPQWTGAVHLVPEHLADPLRWTRPRRVFVNSMSDLFHERLTNEEIAAVFGVMAAAPRHTFQILTKRAKRMREWFEWVDTKATLGFEPHEDVVLRCTDRATSHALPIRDGHRMKRWPLPNVWLGVSAEDQQRAAERIPELLRTPAAVRFVSYEPALGPIDFAPWLTSLRRRGLGVVEAGHPHLDWIIVGGESGPRARPFDVQWARSVVEQCKAAGVACFVKQMGSVVVYDGVQTPGAWWPKQGDDEQVWLRDRQAFAFRKHLKNHKGGDMGEWPEPLRVRQFPEARP